MKSFSISSLKKETSFTGNLMIDSNFMFLPAKGILTQSMINAAIQWGFTEFTCDGDISLDTVVSTLNNETNRNPIESQQSPTLQFNESVKKALEKTGKKLTNTDNSRMEVVTTYYTEFMNYIELLFTRYTTHGEINQRELHGTIQNLCVFIKENRRYILRVNPSYEENAKSYLINHTMRSTVLAIAIALQLHMPLSQMTDLGVSCILHEIGMLSLPPQLYMTQRKLTSGERKKIKTHSVEGLKIVQKLEFSAPIQMGVLQHHEKENGTGYPQGLTGDKITNIAKIISVACSFEAISSPRNYKIEKTSFDAMLEMLKNENHQYDETVIKALLYSVSLFPIGAYVYLRNGKIGLVVDVNPENPKCPIVQLILEKGDDNSPKTVQTDNGSMQIVRVLSIKEQQDVKKVIEEAEKKQNEIEAEKQQNESETENITTEKSKKDDNGVEEVDVSFFD